MSILWLHLSKRNLLPLLYSYHFTLLKSPISILSLIFTYTSHVSSFPALLTSCWFPLSCCYKDINPAWSMYVLVNAPLRGVFHPPWLDGSHSLWASLKPAEAALQWTALETLDMPWDCVGYDSELICLGIFILYCATKASLLLEISRWESPLWDFA